MKDILESIQGLQNTPVPNLLVVAGVFFLLLAFVGGIGEFIKLPKERQKWAAILGAILLGIGIFLFIPPNPPSDPGPEVDEIATDLPLNPISKKYGIVLEVGTSIEDAGFNRLAWQGMQLANQELGVEISLRESKEESDYLGNISNLIQQGHDGIVTVGFRLADATKTASAANPNVPFAIVDYISQTSNDMGLIFAVDEPSFLAGYLAAGMSETGIVCTFGGEKIDPVLAFMVGFEQGVLYYNQKHSADVEALGWHTDPDAEMGGEGSFAGNFTEWSDGRRLAEELFDDGCDVIFPVAGSVGLGSAEVAQEQDRKVIGVDMDLFEANSDAKEVYLTSVLKKIDILVFEAVKQMDNETFKGGQNYIGTLKNGGVGLAPFHNYENRIPQDLQDDLENIKQGIVNGNISTGWPPQ